MMKIIRSLISLVLTCSLLMTVIAGITVNSAGGEYKKLEAEVYGVSNLYSDPRQESAGYSGGIAVGGCSLDYNKAQTFSSVGQYLDKSNTAYVSYTVYAPEDGVYNIKNVYNMNKGSTDFYFTVLVNDSTAYKDFFVPRGANSNWNDSVLAISLKKGMNIIRCIPYVYETRNFAASGWHNQDYLQIDSRLDGILPGDTVRLEAEKSEYINKFDTVGSSSVSGAALTEAENEKISTATLSLNNMTSVPYFSYTVDVLYDGYYDITLYFNTGHLSTGSEEDYFAFGYMIDGRAKTAGYRRKTDNSSQFQNNRANIPAYFTAGTHTVVITGQLPRPGTDQKYYWVDFDALEISGSVVKSEKQIDPRTLPEPPVEFTRLEAEIYGTANLYNDISQMNNAYSGNACVGECSIYNIDWDYLQTYSSLSVYLHKSNTPYVSYSVIAPHDGDYKIKPSVVISDYCEEYFFTVLVNDNKTYQIFSDSEKIESEITVFLKEGINIIRCIPYTKELLSFKKYPVWNNQDYLDIDDRLTGVLPSYVRLEAENSPFYNRFSVSGDHLGGAEASYMRDQGITVDTLTHEKKKDVSYFSYTIDVPIKGYYDISIGFNTDWAIRYGSFALMIDDQKALSIPYGKASNDETSFKKNIADFSAALTEGTHVLTFVAQIPETDPNATYQWTDFDAVTFYGGIKMSDSQLDPETLEPPRTSHLEAEIYGVSNLYIDTNQKNASYSGGACVGKCSFDYNKMQTFEELSEFLDKSNSPYVAYYVMAPEDGSYEIKPVYYLNNASQLKLNPRYNNYYFTLLVNDIKTYKSPFEEREINSNWNSSTVTVELKKGLNLIRCIPHTYETRAVAGNSGFYINQDYLELDSRLYGVLPQTACFDAGKAPYINNFNLVSDTVAGETDSQKNSGLTVDTLTRDTLQNAAYFSYSFTAPYDGYFDITVPFRYDQNNVEEEDCYFALMVDGNTYSRKFRKATDNSNSFEKYKANFTVYLKEGDHSLVFTAQMPKSGDGTYGWTDFESVTVYGGLKIAEKNIDPYGNYIRMEAENFAERFGYSGLEQGGFSGGYAVANGSYYYAGIKTDAECGEKLDLANPYISYTVNASEAGIYKIKPGFTFGTNGTIPEGYKPYIYIYVNGKPYKAVHTGSNNAIASPVISADFQKGRNEIVCAIFPKEVYDAVGQKSSWINFDYLDIQDSLTPVMPETAAPESEEYIRIEAETGAYNNSYISSYSDASMSGKSGARPNTLLSAQNREGLKNGLDMTLTPFVQYEVIAPSDGNYNIRIGLKYVLEGTDLPADRKAYIAVYVNGAYKEYALNVNDNKSHIATIEENVELRNGKNIIQVTSAAEGAAAEDQLSYVIVYQDYLDIEKDLTALLPSERLEAEDSKLNRYMAEDRGGSSGGKAAMHEDFETIYRTNLTFDKLNDDTLGKVSTVTYSVFAEKAGKYTVYFGFHSEGGGTALRYKPFFAMIVNKGRPQKIYYDAATNMSRIVEVDLNEGENTVLVTCILADCIDDSGNLYWIDHDYIQLSEGLQGLKEEIVPPGAGDEYADLGDPLLFVDLSKVTDIIISGENGIGENSGTAPDTGERNIANIYLITLLSGVSTAVFSNRIRKYKKRIADNSQ